MRHAEGIDSGMLDSPMEVIRAVNKAVWNKDHGGILENEFRKSLTSVMIRFKGLNVEIRRTAVASVCANFLDTNESDPQRAASHESRRMRVRPKTP